MAEKLLVQLEDSVGNIYYLHTSADVVFCEDGISVQTKLAQKIEKADIIQNATTASTTKVVSASVAKNLQDQINEQNTNLSNGFEMYNSLSALGLPNGKTINQVLYAMPKNSEFWSYFGDMAGITDIPEAQVFVHAIKCGNIQLVEAISLWGDRRYIGGYNGNGAVLGWKKYTAV